MKLDLEKLDIILANHEIEPRPIYSKTVFKSLRSLYEFAKDAKAALEFMMMPITTPKENLTVDRLLATMNEDTKRGRKTLRKYFKEKK